MGMFDNVNVQIPCPACGRVIMPTQFQTKDGEKQLAVIPADRVYRFYAECGGCLAWVEFTRPAPPAADLPITSVAGVLALGFGLSVRAHVVNAATRAYELEAS